MADLIKLLKQFNRKERYFLIRQALGVEEFQLSERFRKKLGRKIGLKEEIPCDAFAAMDYHLDWVAASLQAYRECMSMDEVLCKVFSNSGDEKVVMGNQQDIDFLIAFNANEYCHLVFLEAKGYGSWDSNQMREKAIRLEKLFEDDGTGQPKVKPYFYLTSYRPPSEMLKIDNWPKWMKEDGVPRFLKLDLLYPRLEVNRCDRGREPMAKGDFFRIEKVNEPRNSQR